MFLDNPFIQTIANTESWTISIINGDEKHPAKKPLDIIEWIEKKKLIGALYKIQEHPSCITLPKLLNWAKQFEPEYRLSHVTHQLNINERPVIILDIEPSCPEPIKQNLMKLPYEYKEPSMSGKGIHLGFTLPREYQEKLSDIKQLKQKKKYYEILTNHFVTFTMQETGTPKPGDQTILLKLIDVLLAQKNENATDIVSAEPKSPDIPDADLIIGSALQTEFQKTIDQYDNDESRWEYGYLWHIISKILTIIEKAAAENHDYTDNEIIWLVYETAKEQIPHRPKHDTLRNGKPFLLFRTEYAYSNYKAKIQKDNAKRQKKKA